MPSRMMAVEEGRRFAKLVMIHQGRADVLVWLGGRSNMHWRGRASNRLHDVLLRRAAQL